MRFLNVLLLVASCLAVQGAAAEKTDVVSSFTAASSRSEQRLRGSTMGVDIFASVPRLEKSASLQALRSISVSGAVTYGSILLTGDESVRHQVIARYLSADENLESGRDPRALALTPANYRFAFRNQELLDGRRAYVFQVKPRRKQEGAFEGEVWIDAETYLPLREAGKIVQHSIFLRRLTMVRKFRIVDRVAFPESTDLKIDTRLVGKAQMTVKLHNLTQPSPSLNALAPAVQ